MSSGRKRKHILSEESLNSLLTDYNNGVTVTNLKRKYNIPRDTIYSILYKKGITLRSLRETILPENKRCKTCDEIKPIIEFQKTFQNSSGYGTHCIKCCKERARIKSVVYRKRGKYKKYGINTEIFKNMVKEQNGMCKICGNKLNERLFVDHCHETGIVRGLICNPCNLGLGWFKDNPLLLKEAIEYINNFNDGIKKKRMQEELLSRCKTLLSF